MTDEKARKRKRRKRRFVAAVCWLCGTLILLAVIAACLSVTLPRYFGYEIFHVVSGSMEPQIPVGSIAYVQKVPPETIEKGQIIAFYSGNSVVIHRAVKNQIVEGYFNTKGDANDGEDMNDVKYDQIIGIVRYHYPVLGQWFMVFTSQVGKFYVICFAACGALLNIIAGRLW